MFSFLFALLSQIFLYAVPVGLSSIGWELYQPRFAYALVLAGGLFLLSLIGLLRKPDEEGRSRFSFGLFFGLVLGLAINLMIWNALRGEF